jgi:hypothetical protein
MLQNDDFATSLAACSGNRRVQQKHLEQKFIASMAFQADAHSSQFRTALSLSSDSKVVCEAYCADALIEGYYAHFCQGMSKISVIY